MLHSFSNLRMAVFCVTLLVVTCTCNKAGDKASHFRKEEIAKNNSGTLDLTGSITYTKPIYRLPDSLLTPQEIQWKQLYLQLILNYVVVENNRYKLNLSRGSFLRTGIPAAYYDELIKSMNETNKWLEEMKIDSLSSLSERARQEAKDQLQTSKKGSTNPWEPFFSGGSEPSPGS